MSARSQSLPFSKPSSSPAAALFNCSGVISNCLKSEMICSHLGAKPLLSAAGRSVVNSPSSALITLLAAIMRPWRDSSGLSLAPVVSSTRCVMRLMLITSAPSSPPPSSFASSRSVSNVNCSGTISMTFFSPRAIASRISWRSMRLLPAPERPSTKRTFPIPAVLR
ncbi:hypothetical protein SDC9_145060 [bioreactor metagenome]|uniref:Uncharacterized protein n=1 Tax=bioreactor metagenome TaxID=1076179 RepID=A0A645E7Y4_9ZZZZ